MTETGMNPEQKDEARARRARRWRAAAAAALLLGVVLVTRFIHFDDVHFDAPALGGLPTPIAEAAAVGATAPDFTAVTPAGDEIALSDYRGQPVAINFWATWCAPCEVEMPALQAATERHSDAGLAVLAVNAGEGAETVETFMDERGLTFPALLDPDGDVLDLYEVRVFPTTVWVGADGVVRAKHLGPLDDALIDRYVADLAAAAGAAD